MPLETVLRLAIHNTGKTSIYIYEYAAGLCFFTPNRQTAFAKLLANVPNKEVAFAKPLASVPNSKITSSHNGKNTPN